MGYAYDYEYYGLKLGGVDSHLKPHTNTPNTLGVDRSTKPEEPHHPQ